MSEGAKQSAVLTFKSIAPPAPAPVAQPLPAPPPPSSGGGLRAAGWIGVVVGAAGLGVGTFFVVKNHADRSDANGLCGAMGCPDSKRSQISSDDDSANTASTAAWVSYGVGAGALVAGVTMIWLGRGKAAPPQTGQAIVVAPWFSGDSAGLRGTF